MTATLAVAGVQLCHADLGLLGRLAYQREELAVRLPQLAARAGAGAAVVVSTCNRTELYASLPTGADPDRLVAALAADRGLPVQAVRPAARLLTGHGAVLHLLRVVAGLESLVVGEAEIAGQVRAAAVAARSAGLLSGELDALFRAAATTARRVRTDTALGRTAGSLGAAAVEHAAALLRAQGGGSLPGRRVLVVGAGQLATAVARRATAAGAAVLVCNRTRSHALGLAADPRDVFDLDELGRALESADAAFVCTSAPHPLIGPRLVRRAVARRGRLLLVDLALPRNVDPAVREWPTVALRDLDDLRRAGLPEATSHAAAVMEAAAVVEQEAARFAEWLRMRRAAALIRALHERADSAALAEVSRTGGQLSGAQRELVEQVVRRVVAKLLHDPTLALRRAAADSDDAVLEWAGRLLETVGTRATGTGAVIGPGRSVERDDDAAGVAGVAAAHGIAVLGGGAA